MAAQLEAGHSSETVPMRGPGSASGDLIPRMEKSSSRGEPPKAGQNQIRTPIPPSALSIFNEMISPARLARTQGRTSPQSWPGAYFIPVQILITLSPAASGGYGLTLGKVFLR